MARIAKTTETSKVEAVETKENKKTNEIKLEDIIKQMSEMQEALAKLTKENAELKTQKSVENTSEPSELLADTDIAVVNECVSTLTLSTDGKGGGNIYRFAEFGEIQDIPWADLRAICTNMPTLAKGGAFYIVNREAVKKLRLTKYYDRLLSDEDMETILDKDANTAVELYKLASDMQKENIIDLVLKRKQDGEEVDANIILALSNLSGKNLSNIEQ